MSQTFLHLKEIEENVNVIHNQTETGPIQDTRKTEARTGKNEKCAKPTWKMEEFEKSNI